MNRDEVIAYCLAKPAAEETYPFGDGVMVVRVGGKMFALVMLGGQSVNLKCDPDLALELRDRFAAVAPGYHQNKRHWNTVTLDGSVPDDELMEMIDHSYDLVFASLTKRVRESLGG